MEFPVAVECSFRDFGKSRVWGCGRGRFAVEVLYTTGKWITVLGTDNVDVLIYITANFAPIATKPCVVHLGPPEVLRELCWATITLDAPLVLLVVISVGLSVLIMG